MHHILFSKKQMTRNSSITFCKGQNSNLFSHLETCETVLHNRFFHAIGFVLYVFVNQIVFGKEFNYSVIKTVWKHNKSIVGKFVSLTLHISKISKNKPPIKKKDDSYDIVRG